MRERAFEIEWDLEFKVLKRDREIQLKNELEMLRRKLQAAEQQYIESVLESALEFKKLKEDNLEKFERLNDAVYAPLSHLIHRYGKEVCLSKTQCVGLLRDYLGPNIRETNVLIISLDENIPQTLLKLEYLTKETCRDFITLLEQKWMITENAAKWVVKIWARLFKLIPRTE